MSLKEQKNGYTLIEVLIYGVIFSLLLLLVTQIFLTIKSSAANSLAMINLLENNTQILADFNQTIRAADNVVAPLPGESETYLSLNNDLVSYQLNAGVLEKVVAGEPLALNDEGVTVRSLNFENVGEATQTPTLKIRFSLESNFLLEGGRTVQEDFETTIGLR